MYCRLLAEAVRRLRSEPVETPPMTALELGFVAGIPKNYISSDRQRLEVYRRIAQSQSCRDLDAMADELADMFGPPPRTVRLLLEVSKVRLLAGKWGIASIVAHNQDLIFSFKENTPCSDLFARCPGRVSILDARTVYVRLDKKYFEPDTLLAVLRKLLTPSR
jgi:transcription-repair coupling factor (superfamily II helicase)